MNPAPLRKQSPFDLFLSGFSRVLYTVYGARKGQRPYPASLHNTEAFTDRDRRSSAAYMRVNHTGEVCAQALYQSQTLTARSAKNRARMQHSADEELDHLAWCEQRIIELKGRKSLLNPLWYGGSFLIGAVAGIIGDKWNLGFVAETERQVVEHLEAHLARLPKTDLRSREIIEQMQADEAQHAKQALQAGAAKLPVPVKLLMKIGGRIMTSTAYRL